MVGRLIYCKRDPNGKRRGAGYYYHRGKGKWTKYNRARDLKMHHSIAGNANVPWEMEHKLDRKRVEGGWI